MKTTVQRVVIMAALIFGLASCSSWLFDEEKKETSEKSDLLIDVNEGFQPIEEDKTDANKAVQVKNAKIEELELKISKLWSRIDELEEQSYRQKERLKLLEKGLLLGIVPDEMKEEDAIVKQKKKVKIENPDLTIDPAIFAEENKALPKKVDKKADAKDQWQKEAKQVEDEKFNKRMSIAEEHFKAQRYGRAIVEYSAIGKEFSENLTNGIHQYWLGRSWANLKEHETARQYFSDFIQKFPTNPWVPRAKVDLAKAEVALGFKEKAVKHLGEVIEQHPSDDAAEMAKTELENIQKSL